jgi:predicted MPP superfamily phosphohydrolase
MLPSFFGLALLLYKFYLLRSFGSTFSFLKAFHSMGFLSFLFCFTLFRDFFALILLIFGRASLFYSANASFAILAASILAYLVGFFNAKFRVISPRILVTVADLPAELKGLKIAQLSDMHLGTGPNAVQTGDIFDGMISDMPLELKELARLKAPQGVYFALGNHECYWSWKDCVAKVKEFGFIPLLNEGVSITIRNHSIFIAGLTDPAIAQAGGDAPRVPVPPKDSRFNLMLVHQPQFAKQVAHFPYDLQLSGHTHGGQFFPWNLAVKKMYPISSGLGKEQNLWVYVSPGTGYWGPPIRLGTLGEVTQLILE